MKIARINVLIHLFKMLMSILCPLNLSVRFLWCVQFLSIKHRGVKQAGGRLVSLLQAWISPFGFHIYLEWEKERGVGEVVGGAEGVLFGKGFARRSNVVIWGILGVFVPFTALTTIPQTSTSNWEYVNILPTRFFPFKGAYIAKNKKKLDFLFVLYLLCKQM